MKQILKQFNSPDTVLVLTSFPEKGAERSGRRDFNAVGWHSQKTLKHLSGMGKVLVCAETTGKKKYLAINNNLLVLRTWKKGSIFSFIKLLFLILKLNRIRSIFVQFEFNVFGGIIPNLFLLALLFVLRILGKNITFELHQVITDVGLLKKHVYLGNRTTQKLFNMGLKLYYRMTGIISNQVIVFEQELKNRLAHFVKKEKIQALSLSVNQKNTPEKAVARKKLGLKEKEFVLLVFGFINGYKGIDWIIEQFKIYNLKFKIKNIRLVIAGGMNPYLKDNPHYQTFYKSIMDDAKKCRQITCTGFVPDNKVDLYFGAADLVVLPYEVFMSASGPFSLALSYNKPVILSQVLLKYSSSKDFKQVMTTAGLQKKDIFFKLTGQSLFKLIRRAKTDKKYYQKLINFSRLLGEKRSSENVIRKLHDLLLPFPTYHHLISNSGFKHLISSIK